MKQSIHWKVHIIEFFAVIIGITIAFTLEEWSKERSIKKLEVVTLENLRNEIQFDVSTIDSILNVNLTDVRLAEKVVTWKRKNINMPNDSLKSALKSMFRMEGFILTLDSYQTLRQSGDINIISSGLIKKQLSKLIIRDYQSTYRQYLACEKAIIDYVLYSDYFNKNYDFINGEFKKESMINDIEFTNRLTLIMSLKAEYIRLLVENRKLFVALNKEIELYLKENG